MSRVVVHFLDLSPAPIHIVFRLALQFALQFALHNVAVLSDCVCQEPLRGPSAWSSLRVVGVVVICNLHFGAETSRLGSTR